MYVATILGQTMGYHRLFTHRAFKAHPALRAVLGVLGAIAAQSPISVWAATHRRHHQFSDRDGDPHSPHLNGTSGPLAVLAGLYHAHIGWLLDYEPQDWERYIPDLLADPIVTTIDRHYANLVLLGFALPAMLGGALGGSWQAAASGLLWGGPVRVFIGFQFAFLVNSICHVYGSRPFDAHDFSRNNGPCALMTLGEGWHNNHHAFPASARHGLFWWQLDVTYVMIVLCSWLGLASEVNLPEASAIATRRRDDARAA